MRWKKTILLFYSITKAIDIFFLRKKNANNKQGIPINVWKFILNHLKNFTKKLSQHKKKKKKNKVERKKARKEPASLVAKLTAGKAVW
jgi:hypothetical protein